VCPSHVLLQHRHTTEKNTAPTSHANGASGFQRASPEIKGREIEARERITNKGKRDRSYIGDKGKRDRGKRDRR